MVGVAGKSRACNTCRRRRVKCDLRRPGCLRCEKANTVCAGYERNPIFINRTPTQVSLTATSVISEAKRQDTQQSLLPIYETELRSLISQATQKVPYIPVEFRRNAVSLLQKLYLPRRLSTHDFRPLDSTYDWFWALSSLTEKSQALDLSILALCTVQAHLTKTSTVTLEESLQFYSEALQHHRTDLEDEQKRYRDESFAAIVVLTTCELFASPIDRPWRVHALGLSEILRLRGASAPETQTFARLYSRMRTVCVLDGLTRERALFLSPNEWPQTSDGIYSKPFDLLLDMLVKVPTLLGRCNAIMDEAEPENSDHEMARIATDLIDVLNQSHAWQRDTRIRPGWNKLPYTTVISQVHNPADDKYPTKLFPFALEFACLDWAITYSFSWSVQLQILNKVINIHRWMSSQAVDLSNLRGVLSTDDLSASPADNSWYICPDKICMSAIKSEAERVARLLCQFFGYCQRLEMGTLGPQICRYPTWILRQYFRQNAGHERELEWVLHAKNMTGPGFHHKLNLMEFDDNP